MKNTLFILLCFFYSNSLVAKEFYEFHGEFRSQNQKIKLHIEIVVETRSNQTVEAFITEVRGNNLVFSKFKGPRSKMPWRQNGLINCNVYGVMETIRVNTKDLRACRVEYESDKQRTTIWHTPFFSLGWARQIREAKDGSWSEILEPVNTSD